MISGKAYDPPFIWPRSDPKGGSYALISPDNLLTTIICRSIPAQVLSEELRPLPLLHVAHWSFAVKGDWQDAQSVAPPPVVQVYAHKERVGVTGITNLSQSVTFH